MPATTYRWCLVGQAASGVAWNVWQRYLIFDGVVRYVGARRMDNDQHNIQPLIPAHTLVDVGIGGEVDRYYWSLKVQNLFNVGLFRLRDREPVPGRLSEQAGQV